MTRRCGAGLAFPAAVIATLAFGAASALALDPTLPPGFQAVTLANNFGPPGDNSIVNVAWAPDGRMFAADRAGYVFVHKPGDPVGTNQLVADISGHVNDAAATDHGLLGIATDKDFATNGYLYLLYTYDDTHNDDTGRKVSTLTRITVDPATNTAVGGVSTPTEATIIGQVPATIGTGADGSCGPPSNTNDCIPSEGSSHSIGTVRVAPDGTLFVGTGDGNDNTKIDPLTFNDNNPQTYRGKIMHIDRNGNGLPGHPFCPADADLSHVCTKIFAEGLRNPFRFTLRPVGGLAIGDVGQNTWEELNLARGGEDFGWPCWEGLVQTPFVEQDNNATYSGTTYCQDRYANAPNATTAPAFSWVHLPYPFDPNNCDRTHGNAAIGGPTYMGDQYPAGFRGTIFFGDYMCQWISRAVVSGNTVSSVEDFATHWPSVVDLETAPDGNLAFIANGEVDEVVWTAGNHPPTISPSAAPTSGRAPLTVSFHGGGSDPDSDALNYDWEFGDGSAHGSRATPSHTYAHAGHYVVTVTADDGRGMTATASVPITVSRPKPRLHLGRVRLTAGAAKLAGRGLLRGSFNSSDSVRRLQLSVWRGRPHARSCRWWSRGARGLKRGSCKQAHWMVAHLHRKGHSYTWTLKLGAAVPKGSYTLVLRALPRSRRLAASAQLRKRLRVR